MEVGQLVRIKEGAFGSSPSPLELSFIGQEGYLRNKDFQGVTGQWLVLVNTALLVMTEKDFEPVKDRQEYTNDIPLRAHYKPPYQPIPERTTGLMEERQKYHLRVGDPVYVGGDLTNLYPVVPKQQHAFTVSLPNRDWVTVKAADCYVDQGALCFEDENDVTIMIFAPGHWVKVERVEDENT